MKPTISTVSPGCAIDTHSPLAILCSPLLQFDCEGQGKAQSFTDQVQCWAFMALQLATYQLIPSERNPRSSFLIFFNRNKFVQYKALVTRK